MARELLARDAVTEVLEAKTVPLRPGETFKRAISVPSILRGFGQNAAAVSAHAKRITLYVKIAIGVGSS